MAKKIVSQERASMIVLRKQSYSFQIIANIKNASVRGVWKIIKKKKIMRDWQTNFAQVALAR